MPTDAHSEIRPPQSWDEFELIVRDLYAHEWGDRRTQLHGRSGQRQHGVDLYGRPRALSGQYAGIQCKRSAEGKLTRQHIDAEIAEAEQFTPPLAEYIIATTESRDAQLQEHVRAINQVRHDTGKFPVHLVFWEDLRGMLTDPGNRRLLEKHYPQHSRRDSKKGRQFAVLSALVVVLLVVVGFWAIGPDLTAIKGILSAPTPTPIPFPKSSGACDPDTPPFYVVINGSWEDLTRTGSGCEPIVLKHPECTDCASCAIDLEAEVCKPTLAGKVLTGQPVYEMCRSVISDPKRRVVWNYRIRVVFPDGTCPVDPNAIDFVGPHPGIGVGIAEVQETTDIPPGARPGELATEYTARVTRRSTQQFDVRISVPSSLASLSQFNIPHIKTDPLAAPNELTSYVTTIYVTDTMRVSLESDQFTIDNRPPFTIEKPPPVTKTVDTQGSGQETLWNWSVTAPDATGLFSVIIKIYLGEDPDCLHKYQVNIEVVD